MLIHKKSLKVLKRERLRGIFLQRFIDIPGKVSLWLGGLARVTCHADPRRRATLATWILKTNFQVPPASPMTER